MKTRAQYIELLNYFSTNDNLLKVIKCQSLFRKVLSNKNNLYYQLKTAHIQSLFKNTIT